MRLQKYLADAGVASRRGAEALIARGVVSVNDRPVVAMGTIVSPGDRVTVDGRAVGPAGARRTLLLHKPRGVMTTMRDPQGRPTVADLIAPAYGRVVPVGRLDYDTSGLLVLTSDGDLAFRLAHPRFGVPKTYRARVRGRVTPEALARVMEGIGLDDGRAQPARVRVVARSNAATTLDVTVFEGRNRLVRRIFETVGHPVIDLERTHFGPLALGGLAVGAVRELEAAEIARLRAATEAGAP